MNKSTPYKLATRVIHEGLTPDKWNGATLPPVFQTAAHVHETAQSLSDTFAGKTDKHIYTRLTNPTNKVLENKLAALEGGKGAIVMASGMAAISNTCMALLRAGDNFVSGTSLFMSTYLLFASVLKKYNITARLVDTSDLAGFEGQIDDKTRFVYAETIGNPAMDVPNIKVLADLAHKHGLPLIVDNTLATPYLVTPISLGADVVVHSTTKFLSGHGNAPGGVVVDGGHFDWSGPRFDDFKPFVDRKGDLALLDRIWREHHINFGTTQAPFHSYLTMIGLDTFVLRMERHLQNAMAVARFLKEKYGISFIYITHDLITARYICDRIAIMYLGNIVEIGPTEEIIYNPRHPYTQALITAVPVPDPTADIPELPIKGYVPITPEDTLDGCNFALRCLAYNEKCRSGKPPMIRVGDGHFASCFGVDGIQAVN